MPHGVRSRCNCCAVVERVRSRSSAFDRVQARSNASDRVRSRSIAFDRVRSRSSAFERVRSRSIAFERNALRRPADCGCVGHAGRHVPRDVPPHDGGRVPAARHVRASPPPRRADARKRAHTHARTHTRGQVQRGRPPRLAVRLLPRPSAERDVLAALALAPPYPLIAKPAPAGDTHHARHYATDTNATRCDATRCNAM
jgi:hypothetical protein